MHALLNSVLERETEIRIIFGDLKTFKRHMLHLNVRPSIYYVGAGNIRLNFKLFTVHIFGKN